MTAELTMSFIIPALNEADHIAATIRSIQRAVPGDPAIIVCDNGSSDDTVRIATEAGASVCQAPELTIAGLRNLGAEKTDSDLLVFLDADVELSADWYETWRENRSKLPVNRLYVTGSRCSSPKNEGFFCKNWFSLLSTKSPNYINSGHMITTRELFKEVNGFDQSLRTGEDHEFCVRAFSLGGAIMPIDDLIAFHFGYPTTALGFIRREIWHGMEDCRSLKTFFLSKTAVFSAFYLMITIAAIASLLFSQLYTFGTLITFLLSIAVIFSIAKTGYKSLKQTAKSAVCAAVYLLSRSISLIFGKFSCQKT